MGQPWSADHSGSEWSGSGVSSHVFNTNSTQISIARTTATVILARHRSQQCWFQFRKTKFFERDKINQNFVSIVCICSVNLLCYLFGEIYLYFSWIVHTQKKISRSPISHLKIGDRKWFPEKVQKSADQSGSLIRSRSSIKKYYTFSLFVFSYVSLPLVMYCWFL